MNASARLPSAGFTAQEFHYRLRWRASAPQSGAHAARTPGSGTEFSGHVPFIDHPDPRRLDIRASLRTFPRQFMARTYHQRSAVTVYALLDLSASMRFAGDTEKKHLLAEIAAAIAWSATRIGDAFGLIACDDGIREDLLISPSWRRGMAGEIHGLVRSAQIGDGKRSGALPYAVEAMRRGRSLVFLVSDFHLEVDLLDRTLASLAPHDVQPVVLWDRAEYADLPAWGWARVRDMESGRERSLFLRKALVQRIGARYDEHRRALAASCRSFGLRPPFYVEGRFDAGRLTRHLLEAA